MSGRTLSMILVAVLAACGGDAESRESVEVEAMEGAAPMQSVRATPPAPATPPPTATRVIPAGTVLTFEVSENVSTSSHVSGDSFSLTLVDEVTGSGGAVLTAGTSARGLVTDVRESTGPEDQAVLGVRVASIVVGGSSTPIEGVVRSAAVESSSQDSGSRTAATIATGAAAGAIIGQILGRDTRSTVTGAAAGAAVGVGVALTTRGGDATLPRGSRIVVRLDRDLVL